MFIAFEGLDGSGKSTQSARLVARLQSSGHDVLPVNDPGTTAFGKHTRETLLHGCLPICTMAEMLTFCAVRAQLVEEIIRPALAVGKIVVADRYVLSTLAYQGYGGGLNIDDVRHVNRLATASLYPCKTFVFDVPVGVALARCKGGTDRIERRGTDYFERLRTGYRREAAALQRTSPGCVEFVDATCGESAVAEFVWETVEAMLAVRVSDDEAA